MHGIGSPIARIALGIMVVTSAWPQLLCGRDRPACGRAKVHLSSPEYLTTSQGIVAVQLPTGWFYDKATKNPFYFVKKGETYQNARTIMYVSVERLDIPLQQAVRNDMKDFQQRCADLKLQDLKPARLLEEGCESKTQLFACGEKQGSYVDLVTKIGIGNILLNVVLSADTEEDISNHRSDYEYVLMHITMAQ